MKKRPGRFYYQAVFYENASGLMLPGADGRAGGFTPAYHRKNIDSSPFCIPNELICAKLGTFLGLPIPPFSITYFEGKPFFSSLNFNPKDNKLPCIDPIACAAKFPRLCTGILFFDILVANEDRHDGNLAVDNIANPKQIIVYDHEQALFGGGGNYVGVDRLEELQNRLGITGDAVTGGNECCLLKALNTVEYFSEWRERLWDIPDWYIEDTCNAAVGLGIDQTQANAAKRFLIHRKKKIINIIKSCANALSLINNWKPKYVFLDT